VTPSCARRARRAAEEHVQQTGGDLNAAERAWRHTIRPHQDRLDTREQDIHRRLFDLRQDNIARRERGVAPPGPGHANGRRPPDQQLDIGL
jgi:siroheme synthase (precorrin-2 oxidase/ferrochelatase)